MTTTNMLPVAREAAGYLGDGWQATPGPAGQHAAELTGPDHQRIELSELAGRWHARGLYPHSRHGLPYGITWPKITVAARRGAEALAAEITRRLLPGYLAQLKDVLDYQAGRERDEQAQQEAVERIARLLPGDVRHPGYDASRIIWYLPGHKNGRADICVSGNGTQVSRLELEFIPVETAMRLLEFLADLTRNSASPTNRPQRPTTAAHAS